MLLWHQEQVQGAFCFFAPAVKEIDPICWMWYRLGCPLSHWPVANEGLGWDSRSYKCGNPGGDC